MSESTSTARYDFEIIKAYIDTTKSIVQLSSAGLVLPLTLKTAFLVSTGSFNSLERASIVFSWVSFLLAIAAGTFYSYVSVKYIETRLSPKEAEALSLVQQLIEWGPGNVYGLMMLAFFGGALFVILYSLLMIMGS
jgi:hypothetical protein